MSLGRAIEADRSGRLVEAADLYEALLDSEHESVEVFLNLLVLYWQVTDFGFWVGHGLPEEFVGRAGQRLHDLLEDGVKKYEENIEAISWKRYILWADLDEPFSTEDCLALLEQDRRASIPIMVLFTRSEGTRWREEALILLEECRQEGTTRAGYVQSIIDAVLTSPRSKGHSK